MRSTQAFDRDMDGTILQHPRLRIVLVILLAVVPAALPAQNRDIQLTPPNTDTAIYNYRSPALYETAGIMHVAW